MNDLKYLDYNGLLTYTDCIKDEIDSRIVYLDDESQIPDPPVEGTLYVIGSNTLQDMEIIIGSLPDKGTVFEGVTEDTNIYPLKHILFWIPPIKDNTNVKTLVLKNSSGSMVGVRNPIYLEPGVQFRSQYSGCFVHMIYLDSTIDSSLVNRGWYFINGNDYLEYGNSTETFLRNDGTWSAPRNDMVMSVPTTRVHYLVGSTSTTRITESLAKSGNVYIENGSLNIGSNTDKDTSGSLNIHSGNLRVNGGNVYVVGDIFEEDKETSNIYMVPSRPILDYDINHSLIW